MQSQMHLEYNGVMTDSQSAHAPHRFDPQELLLEGDDEFGTVPTPKREPTPAPSSQRRVEPDADEVEDTADATETVSNTVSDKRLKAVPEGAGYEIYQKLNEEPNPGHIHVNELAYIFGVTPWAIRHLTRSIGAYVSAETAMKEYRRRGGR